MRDIRGFVIMVGDQLGYSDRYTYFTRDYHEAETLLAEVRISNPSMRAATAVLVVDDSLERPYMPRDIPPDQAYDSRPPEGYPRDNPYPSIGKCDACGEPATRMCRDIKFIVDPVDGTKKSEQLGLDRRGCDEHPVTPLAKELFVESPLP